MESAGGIYFRRGKQEVSRCLHRRNLSVSPLSKLVEILISTKIYYFMTAPVFAEETSFAYLASQPDVIFGSGAT